VFSYKVSCYFRKHEKTYYFVRHHIKSIRSNQHLFWCPSSDGDGQYVPLKHRYLPTNSHGITIQNTNRDIFALETSNLIQLTLIRMESRHIRTETGNKTFLPLYYHTYNTWIKAHRLWDLPNVVCAHARARARVCVGVCVCVCERERKRESEYTYISCVCQKMT
jgi:hypothetical protein